MGKIRVKTFGDEEAEEKQKNEIKKRHEARLAELKQAKKAVKAPGMKGGERVVSVGPSEEELAVLEQSETAAKAETKEEVKEKSAPKEKIKPVKKNFHSQKYQSISQLVDKTKNYTLKEALEVLGKLQRGTNDETVELHVNTATGGISGNVTLPHGTGKKTRVVIASDSLIAEIEKGIVNFDILLAEPSMMAKLAKVARILGPKGLMPNPKNGTITQNPSEAVKKYEGGQVNFKTEKAPIIHLTVGKMSFGPEKLSQNIEALVNAIKKQNIVNVTLKSTMSPGIKIKI